MIHTPSPNVSTNSLTVLDKRSVLILETLILITIIHGIILIDYMKNFNRGFYDFILSLFYVKYNSLILLERIDP